MNPIYYQASFSSSSHRLDTLPTDSVAEVAFAGRSNAGKSSAINTLTRSRQLARISKTPGRTQLINHFEVTPGRYLVDLPGYGYAKVSKSQQHHWSETLVSYLIERAELRALVLVMDIRRPLTALDWQFLEIWANSGAALHILLTKADKLSRNGAKSALFAARDSLEAEGVEATLQSFSATTGAGLDDLHNILDQHLLG